MKNLTLQSGTYVTISKGTKVTICNPKWDGDKPETQFSLIVELTKPLTMEVCETGFVKIVK